MPPKGGFHSKDHHYKGHEFSHELLPHQCEGVLFGMDNSAYLLLEETDIQQTSVNFSLARKCHNGGVRQDRVLFYQGLCQLLDY